jgi:uncharacterized protein YjbI with pentapeptide repeats
MSSRTFRHTILSLGSILLAGAITNAAAWTEPDKIMDTAYVNTTCKFEPEAQCSWAVRVGAQIPGVDMRDSSMASMRLDNANLQGANLSGSILHLANLKGANLMLANLEHASLHATNLQGANFMLANLKGANFLDADLSGANLRGANLQGAILIQAKLDNATWTDGRVCAAGSKGECL